IRDNNPVISFESSRLMGKKGEVPEEDYAIPFGQADIKREGSDVTVVALAWLVHEALAAAEELEKEGISVEAVGARTLVPPDPPRREGSYPDRGRLARMRPGRPRSAVKRSGILPPHPYPLRPWGRRGSSMLWVWIHPGPQHLQLCDHSRVGDPGEPRHLLAVP